MSDKDGAERVMLQIRMTRTEREFCHYAARLRGFKSAAQYIKHLVSSDFTAVDATKIAQERARRKE